MNKEELKQMLIDHEGLRLKPYHDNVGKLTIGVGRNLDDCGISNSEALIMLDNDICCIIDQMKCMPVFRALEDQRKMALIDMTFNLGFSGVKKFKRMWSALEQKNFSLASYEMLNSKWARQLPERATLLSQMIS